MHEQEHRELSRGIGWGLGETGCSAAGSWTDLVRSRTLESVSVEKQRESKEVR